MRRIRVINIEIPEGTSTQNVSRILTLVSYYLIRSQLERIHTHGRSIFIATLHPRVN